MRSLLFCYMVIIFIEDIEKWCVSWKKDMESLILWSVCMVPRGKTIPNANILSNRTIANFLLKQSN